MFSQVTQTKSKSCNKLNSFRIMTVTNRIGSWSYELKNIFPKYRSAFRIMLGSRLFHSGIVQGNKKEILKKLCFTLKWACCLHLLILKVVVKNLYCCICTKTQNPFILIYVCGVTRGGGEGGLSKWNQQKTIWEQSLKMNMCD